MANSKIATVETTKVLMDLFIVAIVLIVSLVVYNSFFGVFANAKENSFQNFISLSAKIEEMIDDPDQLVYDTMPFYLSKDYILVGFNIDWNDGNPVNQVNSNRPSIPYPQQCLGTSCLCIYESRWEDDFDDDNEVPIQCIPFDSNVFFYGADGYEQYSGVNPESIFGERATKERWMFSFYVFVQSLDLDNSEFENKMVEWQNKYPFVTPTFNESIRELIDEIPSHISYKPDWHENFINNFCDLTSDDLEGFDGDDMPYEYPRDGVIDGFSYFNMDPSEDFSFSNLYPLNREYLVFYGGDAGYHSGCHKPSEQADEENYCINICKDDEEYESFDSRIMYLEKYQENGKTAIIIAPYEGMILAREDSANDLRIARLMQESMIGTCPIPYASYEMEELNDLKESYQEIVNNIVEEGDGTTPYNLDEDLVYAIIYTQGNELTEISNGKYGLMQLTLKNVAEHCSDLITIQSTNTYPPIYTIDDDQIELLLDLETNIHCGIRVLKKYTYYISSNSDISSTTENILAGYYGGEEVLNSNPMPIFGPNGQVMGYFPADEPELQIYSWQLDHELNSLVELASSYFSCYRPAYSSSTGQCFPVATDSLNYIQWNFGNRRSSGARCHAGIDIMTKGQADVISVADGTVIARYHFTDVCGESVDAVLIDHGDYIINYGEIDSDSQLISVGNTVNAGDVIGKATGCDMLHFEKYDKTLLYQKYPNNPQNTKWLPPTGETVPIGVYNYCRDQNFPMPPELQDPTDFLKDLETKMCG